MNMDYLKRQQKVIGLLERNSLDALIVRKKENIFYLTGARGEDSILFVSHRRTFLITDPRYKEEYLRGAKNCRIEVSEDRNLYERIAKISRKRGFKRIGFESNTFSYAEYVDLRKGLKKIKFTPLKGVVESLRMVKDEEEIKCIKRACRDGCDIMNYALKIVSPNISERFLKNRLEFYIQKMGINKAGFDIIVASGKNASMPHAPVSDKNIRNKETVIIDLGTVNNGYNSDLTRTVFLGKIDRKYLGIYNIVLDAQKAAIEHIKPGIEARSLDAISRQYVYRKGLGKYFLHSLGHGIGLEVHEEPCISRNSCTVLQENMVITVEPGLYIPGWGGVRIEDVAMVAKNGCEILTKGDGMLCK
jgi:Xaa-Pro aminopeptidase